MSPYLCENVHTNSVSNVKEYMYDLIGVSTHVRSLSSGHYTAYVSLGRGIAFSMMKTLVPSGITMERKLGHRHIKAC